eukprot:TRINITY_DN469_c0_g2_i1.p1 TRINITY_DN469_c0_g2~~TRINITY_DN469_c0_g2_i1.p1  ORF type:complete len:721 (+),score=165.62 TRINITY_DN469_c0_g2_i1:4055-6217(+)
MNLRTQSVTPNKPPLLATTLSTGKEEFLLKQRQEDLKKARIKAVREQENELSKRLIKDYKDSVAKKENMEQNAAVYAEYLKKKEEFQRLLRERELAIEMRNKAQKDAIEKAEAAEKAQKAKEQAMEAAKNEAAKRWVEAMKKEKEERAKKITEETSMVNKKKEVLKHVTTTERELAEKYRQTESLKPDMFEDELYKKGAGKLNSGKTMADYMNTRYHNTLIVKHEGPVTNAFEKAKTEMQRTLERGRTLAAKTAVHVETAKLRGTVALDRVHDEKELEVMEKELQKLKSADGMIKIEEGRKKDAVVLEMPYTIMENRKRMQKELEKVFEEEFLEGNPINFSIPEEKAEVPLPKHKEPQAVEMKIMEKPSNKVLIEVPPAANVVEEEEKVPEVEHVNYRYEENLQPEAEIKEINNPPAQEKEEYYAELPPLISEAPLPETYLKATSPQEQAVPLELKTRVEEPKLTSILRKDNDSPAKPQGAGSTLLREFLYEQSPQINKREKSIQKSPGSESLISSSVISSQKSPLPVAKYKDYEEKKETPLRSELSYSPTLSDADRPVIVSHEQQHPKGVLCEIEGESKTASLAEQFRNRKPGLANRMEQKTHTTVLRNEPKERTKESILAMRKQMMKPQHRKTVAPSTIKEVPEGEAEGSSSQKVPTGLLARLAAGKKPEITREDMLKLTNKNYEQLPEVKRKREEERKKQELKERIKNAKELEKVLL